MSINDFVEMTIFLCLICFSIFFYKMQAFIDESGLFIYFFYLFIFFCVFREIQDGCQKWREKQFLSKVASRLGSAGQKFCRNRSISLHFRNKCVFAFYAEIQDDRQKYLWKVSRRL